MRKILFRGECNEVGKYNGQWIEGFYGEDDGKPIIARSTDHGLIGYFCEPDSIGQYTGLTDKNGKKIFEGDIIFDPELKENHIVMFDEGGFCTEEMFLQFYLCFDEMEVEVIGNIYDGNLEELANGR